MKINFLEALTALISAYFVVLISLCIYSKKYVNITYRIFKIYTIQISLYLIFILCCTVLVYLD
jgi:hypothetical protein